MMNHLRYRMNSSAVWFGHNSRWTALVKLQADNKLYAFPVFFFVVSLYPIGPAKSRPSTWKEAYPSVLSVGNFPAGGFEKVVTWNFLHP